MAGLQVTSFYLIEKRVEPTETASFALQTRNTYEELAITNVKISATFTPTGNISVIGTSGDPPTRIINPFSEGKYTITIQTSNTPAGDYKMDIRFDYDLVVPTNLPKFSQESRTVTVVQD